MMVVLSQTLQTRKRRTPSRTSLRRAELPHERIDDIRHPILTFVARPCPRNCSPGSSHLVGGSICQAGGATGRGPTRGESIQSRVSRHCPANAALITARLRSILPLSEKDGESLSAPQLPTHSERCNVGIADRDAATATKHLAPTREPARTSFFLDNVHIGIMISWSQENTQDGTDIKVHQATS